MSLVRKAEPPKFLSKVAAVKGMLGPNPANYPNELTGMLYQQHPYLSEYSTNVQISSQNEVAGYLHGVIVLRPMSAVPNPDAPAIRVPVIVAGRRAFPFDVFITPDGRFQPLTQTRATSTLFHSSPFQAVPRTSLPAQSVSAVGSGFPGTGEDLFQTARYGQTKVSSVLGSVLENVDPQQVEAFLSQVNADPELLASMREFPSFAAAVRQVATTPKVQKTASVSLQPIATLLEKTPTKFLLTTAMADESGAVVELHTEPVSRAIVDSIPHHIKQAALEAGHVVLTEEVTPLEEVSLGTNALDKVASADTTGIYAVVDDNAVAKRVAVVAGLRTLEGRNVDRLLVIGEEGTDTHEKLAGIRCGDFDVSLADGPVTAAEGRGVFIFGNTVTEPFTVRGTSNSGGFTMYGHTDLGRNYTVKTASVRVVTKFADDGILLPEGAKFLPLTSVGRFASDSAHVKVASALGELSKSYTVAANSRGGVDITDAYGALVATSHNTVASKMLLAVIGDTDQGAREKVAKLQSGRVSSIQVLPRRPLRLYEKAKVATVRFPEAADIRQDLVKEAAVLAAPDTIDAVLSLGFVTDTNAATYVEFLPVFEDTLGKLAETLLGARIGVPDIPENALTSAMMGLDKAIQGLKKLQIRLSLTASEQAFN